MDILDLPDDTGLFFDDPEGDRRLGEVSEFTRNAVHDIARRLLARGQTPTVRLIVRVMARLKMEPPDADVVEDLLMEIWRAELDAVDATDIQALQAHLKQAPVPGHRWSFFVNGLIVGLAVNPFCGCRLAGERP